MEEVFSLEREGELDKFAPYREKLSNRMLLWHGKWLCYTQEMRASQIATNNLGKFSSYYGFFFFYAGSRLTNFVGILSQGLRIAPPEAPATGYMVLLHFLYCTSLYTGHTHFFLEIKFVTLLHSSLARGSILLIWSVRVLSIALQIGKIPWASCFSAKLL